jgi:Uma2 family endonuclease
MSGITPLMVPLESGDRLTREEFHRRYCLRPDIHKAELIQGVVYVASPTRATHGQPHFDAIGWLYAYCSITPGVQAAAEATVYLSDDDEFQPDVCLFYDPPRQASGARLTEDKYIEGTPDLVVEIAASSAAYDLHDKLESYRRAGVPEYIVWQVYEGRIIWLRLSDGQYVRLEPDDRGVIASEIFPGLRLNVPAMLTGNRAAVVAELTRQAEKSDQS